MHNIEANGDNNRPNVKSTWLKDQVPHLCANGEVLERVASHKFLALLGVWVRENLKWNDYVSSCREALSTIIKIKNMTSTALKKQLVKALLLSKLDYNDIVMYPQPQHLQTKLQRVQKRAAGFVGKRYAFSRCQWARMAPYQVQSWIPPIIY